ncbi:MAG: sulfatase [Planctomycetaceae bacterium]|nr:sulfatase [Planctomycetaceae bacterium]MBP60979.1 sulfatase [Planctomycetaceae bacterium]
MNPELEHQQLLTRRHFFQQTGVGIGGAALSTLLSEDSSASPGIKSRGSLGGPHFAPRAKRVIYLCQSGGPAQMDLFDDKPKMRDWYDVDLPDSVRKGQRLTTMTSTQDRFPVAPSIYSFDRHGRCGTRVSELLPYTAGVVDRLCVVKSLFTEAINHDPAITFLQTGSERAGRPSLGAWLAYGLGTENQNLPAFVVMTSCGKVGQPLYKRLWGSGFLPTTYQGVRLRGVGAPVLYLSNPPGMNPHTRRQILDDLQQLNQFKREEFGDPEISSRIAQYEMAFRMQTSVPELADISDEPEHIFKMYGEDARRRGTYAFHCLLARRLIERGVRFVQLFHRGWDQHDNLTTRLPEQCRDTDQSSAALIRDLDQRGLLDDTLVIWGGEFGRTIYCQDKLTRENYGRDHHPRCFSMWLAGGGIAGGRTYGATDDFSYSITRDPVHVHDLNATILHCLGIDHKRLTYRFQSLDQRLTDVHGQVVQGLMA